MTRLIPLSEITNIPFTDTYIFWTKEDYSGQDTFIAQSDSTETKFKVDGIWEKINPIKSGWRMFILSEPTN